MSYDLLVSGCALTPAVIEAGRIVVGRLKQTYEYHRCLSAADGGKVIFCFGYQGTLKLLLAGELSTYRQHRYLGQYEKTLRTLSAWLRPNAVRLA